MPELQRPQFEDLAKRLNVPDAGFSISVRTGKEPTTGYMVSQAGTEEHRKFAPQWGRIAGYVRRNRGELMKRGRYLGGWADPNPRRGGTDLDISRRYIAHDRARAAMWANDQQALFRLDPSHPEGGYSETNWEKVGTEGTVLGRYVHDPGLPEPEYDELRKAAKARHH